MANTIKFYRGNKASMPTLGVGVPALATDTGAVYIGTSSGNENVSATKVGGYSVTVPASSWAASGSNYVATITDANVFAETTNKKCRVHIDWDDASFAQISGRIQTDTKATGGSYTLTAVGFKPSGSITGVVTIERVNASW